MTADGFRKLALSMPGAVEAAHMGHPDFRANGRIFATLWHDMQWGMVKLTPELQREFIAENPKMFVPVNGAWGAEGATRVHLRHADEETLGRAMTEAFKRTSIKKPRNK
ncbi:MAG TPA: MmcQ/YjbR family DNA-binding protein [Bryobacteraceae bacterium]|nr:MmcQ/YjbR family DNA-binding protein [Bryobacteraceae bacterium]